MLNIFPANKKSCKVSFVWKFTALYIATLFIFDVFSMIGKTYKILVSGGIYFYLLNFCNQISGLTNNFALILKASECYCRSAYSLAECIIVGGIIGIAAELSLPQMITSVYQMSTIEKLRATYATVSSAYSLAISENGSPDNWQIGAYGDQQGLSNINTYFTKYFRLAKNCGTGTGCFPEETYKNLKGMSRSCRHLFNPNKNRSKIDK